ncbi:MAG: hypothetical protein JRJ27_18245 [Deltaproteobacteria bacterium]|nr:hypothetical protein [Deltaproteobacteria bacterium]
MMTRCIRKYYFKPLTRVVQEPRTFFNELKENNEKSYIKAFGFVIFSSAISALAGTLMSGKINPLMMYSIFFVNAFGMVLISVGIGYIFMRIIGGKSIEAYSFFSVYAFSCGTTLLLSWIPYSIWIIEPWKWWLIGTGLIRGCGLQLRQTLAIILFSISIMIVLFWFLLRII